MCAGIFCLLLQASTSSSTLGTSFSRDFAILAIGSTSRTRANRGAESVSTMSSWLLGNWLKGGKRVAVVETLSAPLLALVRDVKGRVAGESSVGRGG